MNLEMLSANWWPFCLCLNVLTHHGLNQDGGDSADHSVGALSCMKLSEYWSTVHSVSALQWHHNGCDSISNHQPRDCLLNCLFGCRSKKTSKLCVTGLCVGNSRVTGEFPAQMASSAENVSIWWRHHDSIGFHWPYISIGLYIIRRRIVDKPITHQGVQRSGKSQGNSRLGKRQGKVRKFCWRSGKNWILGKVR